MPYNLVATILLLLSVTHLLLCQLNIELPSDPTHPPPPLPAAPSFVPDWNSRSFLKDGKPFQYISGEFHYTRVLPEYWQERLQQMKAAGLDAVQTYVFWNVHEPRPGEYDFAGRYNLSRFIDLAHQEGLLVILRVGPYVGAQWELGGMPSWLLANQGIYLRTGDLIWQQFVGKWLQVLLPIIKPHLYSKGGPVILMQYENEYGTFGADVDYISDLVALFSLVLPNEKGLNLFSIDDPGVYTLSQGSKPGTLATVDFDIRTNVTAVVLGLRTFMAGNPFVTSELYTGWYVYWDGWYQRRATDQILLTLNETLVLNGSANLYMFTGGTNFGFMNGVDPEFMTVTTSFDFNAPISEGGDLTDKYFVIRNFIQNYRNVTLPRPPKGRKKIVYGKVPLEYFGYIFDEKNLAMFKSYSFATPVTMEMIDQSFGFILYQTTFATGPCKQGSPSNITMLVQDRAHLFLNGELFTILNRISNPVVSLYKNCSIANQKFEVFVENMGRISFEQRGDFSVHSLYDKEVKGIILFDKKNESTIKSWEVYSVPLKSLDPHSLSKFEFSSQKNKHLCFYQGVLPNETQSQNDTYLYLDQFSKGQAFINSFNLGRYWPANGPQKSLYVPGSIFYKDAPNYITLFELDNCTHPNDAYVTFLDVPDLGT